MWEDLALCSRISGDRRFMTAATALTSARLTYAAGYIVIDTNAALRTINFPWLNTIGGDLNVYSDVTLATISLPALDTVLGALIIRFNPILTHIHLPKLTFIGGHVFFCANDATFTIPSGPPDAPTGGFKVSGSNKGTMNCQFQQGSASCGTLVSCP
jgi:hypothetical protein